MAFSKQSCGSSRTLRSSGDSTKENVEGPVVVTSSKKLRSVRNVDAAPGVNDVVFDSTSTRHSRKGGADSVLESGDSSRIRQPLSGIQNVAHGVALMTRARRSRNEHRLASVLNRNSGEGRKVSFPSQESRLGSDWRIKKTGEVGSTSVLQGDSAILLAEPHLSSSHSSQASFSPSGVRGIDNDHIPVANGDEHVQLSSSNSLENVRTSSEIGPSSHGDNAFAVAVRHERVLVENPSPKTCERRPASSAGASSSENYNVPVTPARRPSSRHSIGALHTPEHLVPALGEGVSPRNLEAATEGRLRVYERRTSRQLGRKSSRAKTCPQLKTCSTNTALTRGKGPASQPYTVRNLKDLFATRNKVCSARKTSVSSSSQNNHMQLPESYLEEKCAYFAEVDAFELLEEEADEEEDLEERKKQKCTGE